MQYTVSDIARILRIACPGHPDAQVKTLLVDSRSLGDPEGTLFFALRTITNDGHRYIRRLYDRGVRNFVVDHIPADMPDTADANFLKVADTRRALQSVARYHRSRFDIPVIGITGSRGKTTVKEWLNTLLSPDYNIVRSPRSYNSQIGVPLSIQEMDTDTTLAIFEAGISLPDEMTSLQQMIRPTVGIITNIGPEHDEGFSSLEAKIEEKVTLFRDCDCVIYNGDNKLIADAVARAALPAKEIAWSMHDSFRPLFIRSIVKGDESTTISYSFLDNDHTLEVPMTSDIDIENVIHCLSVALYLGKSAEVIAERVKRLTPVATRIDVIEGVNRCMIVSDTYTSDLNSLNPALDFMERHLTASRTRTVILSDLVHECDNPVRLYRRLARILEQRGIDRFIGVGPEMVANSHVFSGNVLTFGSTAELLTAMSADDFNSELILIKGAPDFDFGMITEMLEARRHETVLQVNLDNLVHNYNLFRAKVRPETGIVCMVKASGYGAGSYELAKTLQAHGAAYLAVAVLDEGVGLREAGITMPIMVLNPKVENYRTLFAYRLEPEIYSFEMLARIVAEATKNGVKDYPVHIKLDTGMHRLGFVESEMPRLLEMLKSQNAVRPKSIFSHLCAADEPSEDDYTREQFAIFDRCCDKLQSGFDFHILRHILNSTGITRFPDHQFDMVRLGICLYGCRTMPDSSQDGLKLVSSLRSVIIAIREWPAGTTIGYNRRGVLHRRSRIATVPVGYADGYLRHFGNGHASMLVNGHRCPTVGNICMDICMIDVTDVDCRPGDVVEIFGDNITPDELADVAGTISYEILTSVKERVKRIYYQQ